MLKTRFANNFLHNKFYAVLILYTSQNNRTIHAHAFSTIVKRSLRPAFKTGLVKWSVTEKMDAFF